MHCPCFHKKRPSRRTASSYFHLLFCSPVRPRLLFSDPLQQILSTLRAELTSGCHCCPTVRTGVDNPCSTICTELRSARQRRMTIRALMCRFGSCIRVRPCLGRIRIVHGCSSCIGICRLCIIALRSCDPCNYIKDFLRQFLLLICSNSSRNCQGPRKKHSYSTSSQLICPMSFSNRHIQTDICHS